MHGRFVLGMMALAATLSGCTLFNNALCSSGCQSHSHNASSLVAFLYPDGAIPPSTNTIPELHVPLRVGLAFLPAQDSTAAPLNAAQKEQIMERIRERFATRKFVSQIVVIPDYYLTHTGGYSGLQGVQRLYDVDVMALVSYDQVTRQADNHYSLAYLTIIGAYVIPGTSRETATLVDLAVVDPASSSLILRAGGTSASHGKSSLIGVEQDAHDDAVQGFTEAAAAMIDHFDVALSAFEADVKHGSANVKVVARSAASGSGGGGSLQELELLGLALVAALVVGRRIASVRHG